MGPEKLAAHFVAEVGDGQAFPGMAALERQALAAPQPVRGEVLELDDDREAVGAGDVENPAGVRRLFPAVLDRIAGAPELPAVRSVPRAALRGLCALLHGYCFLVADYMTGASPDRRCA
ncbi:hypothetical protein D9M71_590110 [compost metagenome]